MKEQSKCWKILNNTDLQNEKGINQALKKEGFYSSSHGFPIAALQFELTSHCNLACKHCYNNSGIHNISDAITPKKWIAFAEYLVEHGGIFECILSGGEPLLLGDDLFQIMDILHEDDTIFFLITNGYLLTKEIVKKLKKYRYHKIQVSIDGSTPEYHDSFRQRSGSWKKAVDGAFAVSSSGIPLKIAHCVTPYNIHNIDDMCTLAYSLGATSIMVGELCLSGRAALNQELLLSNEQREMLANKVKENMAKYDGRMCVNTSHSVKEGLVRHYKSPNSGAIIRPNGDIRIDGMAPFVVGNILKEDFAEIWIKKIYESWNDPKVLEFIEGFDEMDRNHSYINYVEGDIYI
ncbi:MAG: radical SAM protein [Lachnospiraceae bacterium]|nr:radical SAM protein [Lachnospiraceae bacterium]